MESNEEIFKQIINKAQDAVVLRDKQIDFLCKKLEQIERALYPIPLSEIEAKHHRYFDWKGASLMFAKGELDD